MKISCIAYLHGAGGAERQIVLLANNLARQGEDVSLIVLVENNSNYYIDDKVNVIDLSFCEKKKGNRILNRYQALRKVYETITPQITIHFWLQSAYLTSLMPNYLSGKIIYSERGNPSDSQYNGLLGIVRKYTFKHIDGFVFQSNSAKSMVSDMINTKAIVIPNPVFVPEDKYPTPCKNREKRIINIGRLYPQKNQKLLIEAFSKLSNDFDDYSLDIYGDGILKDELHCMISSLDLNSRVYLRGTTSDIYQELYYSSLFVLSSDYEGLPNALMEAMALGVPCVSTDFQPGSVHEIITNKVNGYIVPAQNVDALRLAIEEALTSSNTYQLCENALQIRQTHCESTVFEKWRNFIYLINDMG